MKRSKGFSHYLLTKFNTQPFDGKMLYDDKEKADAWMDKRMKLFEETKKSVLEQEGEFKWIISVDKRTPQKYLDEIFTDERMIMTNRDIREAFKDEKFKTEWIITTRIDNDDLYLPGAIKAIQSAFAEEVVVIDLLYLVLDKNIGKTRASGRRTPNSPFLSLVEHYKNVRTAFARPHTYMIGEFGKGVWADRKKVYAYQVVHEDNVMNK